MHYLVTGHTGFKGSWLVLLLKSQGHTVSGIALDPDPGSLFESAKIAELMQTDLRIDIRDAAAVGAAVHGIAPDAVLHLAAQALVRESYFDPRTTFETNVQGTLNVLEAVSSAPSVLAHVVVTTDKVYANIDQEAGYVETDRLGASDPYSSSKAMADLLTQSWVKSISGPPTAIVRGGNVIGGGDQSTDRLIPDLMRSFSSGEDAVLRHPDAVRPWQHVIDCLDGYLAVCDALLSGGGLGEWNIGPGRESFVRVGDVATRAAELWGAEARWRASGEPTLAEANLLALNPTKAQTELGWSNLLTYPLSLDWTIQWYTALANTDSRALCLEQLERYRIERAQQ